MLLNKSTFFLLFTPASSVYRIQLTVIRIRLENAFLGLLRKDLCSVSYDRLYDNEHQIAEFAAFAFYILKERKCNYPRSSSVTVKVKNEGTLTAERRSASETSQISRA